MDNTSASSSPQNVVRRKFSHGMAGNVDAREPAHVRQNRSTVGQPTTIEINLQGSDVRRPSPIRSTARRSITVDYGADTPGKRHSVDLQIDLQVDHGHGSYYRTPNKQPVTSVCDTTYAVTKRDIGKPAPNLSVKPKVTTLQVTCKKEEVQNEAYRANDLGIFERYICHRSKELCKRWPHILPRLHSKRLYVDEGFPLHVAIPDAPSSSLSWKRPKEFRSSPVLIQDGVRKSRRGNIGQGSAGTCWFLAGLASLSEKEELLQRILPDDSYHVDDDQYDGIFKCRFWRFGEWIDVYTDDYLPVTDESKLWGAHSLGNRDEMWVPLIEKAFARLYGSYRNICGGNSGTAFLTLTGGVSELIDFNKMKMKPERLYDRMRNSLHSGAMITCCVLDKYDGVNGLVSNHTYSLTEADEVCTTGGDVVSLVRVRNPWGDTKWTGAWSDGSPEWDDLVPGQSDKTHEDIGEFFMSLWDFLYYFSEVQICSVLPDYDRSGCRDSLGFVTAVYGSWSGKLTGGFEYRLQNPRYTITVPVGGEDDSGNVPVVIQIIQETQGEDVSIRCDLYKVLAESPDGLSLCLVLLGDDTILYTPETQCAYRHKVPPGNYVIIPSTYYSHIEKEYLVRVFTHCPVETFQELQQTCSLFECEKLPDLSERKHVINIFGEWSGKAAAGYDNRLRNPKYTIGIHDEGVEDKGHASVHIQIIQHMEETALTSMRCDVYRVVAESTKNNLLCLEIQGERTNLYTPQTRVTYKHKLETGKYVIIPSTSTAGVEKAFLIRVFASHKMENYGELPHSCVMESDTTKVSGFHHVRNIFGKWTSNSPGGLGGRLENNKYRIQVDEDGTSVQTKEIAIRLVQETEGQTRVYMRCDLYKILAESEDGDIICIELQGEDTNVYTPETQVTYTYKVSTGEYIVIPSKCEEGVEKDYLIRIFSRTPLKEPTEVPTTCQIMESDAEEKIQDFDFMQYIFGRWSGESAAGFQNRTRNPKYELEVPSNGVGANGRLELALQINQQTAGSPDASIRCDIYKIFAQSNNGSLLCLELESDEGNFYTPEYQKTYRHHLYPGKYVIVPSTGDSGIQKNFLIRVYTKYPIKTLDKNPLQCSVMETEAVDKLRTDGQDYKLQYRDVFIGAFVKGVNSGGEVSCRETYASNPQFAIQVKELTAVVFRLMQEQKDPRCSIGIRMSPLRCEAPVDVRYLYSVFEEPILTCEGEPGEFVNDWDLRVDYMLKPGNYLVLLFLKFPTDEKRYCLSAMSSSPIDIKGFQTGNEVS